MSYPLKSTQMRSTAADPARTRPRRRRAAAVLAAALVLLLGPAWDRPAWDRPAWYRPAAAESVTIFAASSTTDVIAEAAVLFESRSGHKVRPVFAASSALARQIAQGAPADLYLSANPRWMDHLEALGLLQPGSRVDLLGNRLVLIAPIVDAAPARLVPGPGLGDRLAALLRDRPLALADPGHVPAGLYAVEALTGLGAWPLERGLSVYAANARAALALVARGEAAAGIVYATDPAVAPGVRVLGTFPAGSHSPIRYPLAIVAGAERPASLAFHTFLRGPEAAALFQDRGFVPPPTGS